MKERTHEEREAVAEAAERQMKRWLLMQQIAQQNERECPPEKLAACLGPYIALSREAGCGGSRIARLVGQKLGWDVLDKELLDFMSQRYHLPRDVLEFVDETTANWLYDTFGSWLDRQTVSHEAYVEHLGQIVLLGARHGRVVLVGRGAQFFLPRDRGLAVRIVASEKFRVEQTMRDREMTRDGARHFVQERDEGRREFVRRYFHHDLADPHLYDLIVNRDQLGPEAAASLIVEAYQHWSGPK
jgi:cytidylate kinase